MLDQALEALKTYEWGVDPKAVQGIQDTVVATHGNADARKSLEGKLAAVLGTDIPRAAKDTVCRALKTIGTAHSVPALAKLLHDEELSHMARHALQAIDAPEAAGALVAAIDKAPKKIKIGIISSLGARGKDVPAAPLAKALADNDAEVSTAGALALGAIGSSDAVKALGSVLEQVCVVGWGSGRIGHIESRVHLLRANGSRRRRQIGSRGAGRPYDPCGVPFDHSRGRH